MKTFYSIWVTISWLLGEAHRWLTEMIQHWMTRFLGFAVVPLLLLIWAPVALAFAMSVTILFQIIKRIPLEERLKLWPNA